MSEKRESLEGETLNRSSSMQDAKVLPKYALTDKEFNLQQKYPDVLSWYWALYKQESLEFLDVLMRR